MMQPERPASTRELSTAGGYQRHMNPITLALLALPLASALAAQTPAPSPASPARLPAPVLQTATFDVAAAFQQHYRAMIEPLVFGRFAIGLSGEYTTEPEGEVYAILYPSCPVNMLCGGSTASDGSEYRAWSFNLHARWYPAALSFGGERQAAALYVGEFIGYHERRTSQPIYYGCPNCYYPPPQPPDTTIYNPPIPPPGGNSVYTQVLRGWEPGVEFGVRLLPMRHVVMDIGGRFRLATIEDYRSGTRPGGVDSRLVVAVGVGW